MLNVACSLSRACIYIYTRTRFFLKKKEMSRNVTDENDKNPYSSFTHMHMHMCNVQTNRCCDTYFTYACDYGCDSKSNYSCALRIAEFYVWYNTR
jgi:hypothetical protein